jgi:UDP:flavonoid glycosyltransferase YjiC (YdhE family)
MPCGREPLLRDAIPFPWDRLDGRPLIYASLGTLQNGRPELFAEIARAGAPAARLNPADPGGRGRRI